MNTFLAIVELEGETIKHLIEADEIAYTTKHVCLMVEQTIVAHFNLDKVISISPYDNKIEF